MTVVPKKFYNKMTSLLATVYLSSYGISSHMIFYIFMTKTIHSAAKIILQIKAERMYINMEVKRGDIYYADLSPVVGSEQGGLRPVLIVQNDVGNRYSPTVIAAAITSRQDKTRLPTHIDIHGDSAGLSRNSVVLLEQMRTLDKRRLKEKMGHLDDSAMNEINTAISVSLGLQ